MNYKHGFALADDRSAANPKWNVYRRWCSMRQRCADPNCPSYPDYGGRGISVCERWQVFANFLADMGPPPFGATLERIDNDGNYEPSNCRWATRKEQSRNRRNKNRYLDFNGERLLICQWAERLGVKPRLLRVRLNRGWSVADTLSRPCDATAGQFK